jgi:hypothetical protein
MALGAHYDKYDPISGGFRAPLAAAVNGANVRVPRAVSLDANGRVVIGTGGASGFVGVIVAHKDMALGEIVDVMTHGEIVDVTGLTAGTVYYATAAGPLGTAAPAAGTNAGRVGHTVESDRLVVRVQQVQG